MKPYKRNIYRKLYSVRLIFVASLIMSLFLIRLGFSDYGYILISLILLGSFFPISDLYIDDNIIIVKQYFIYGLIRNKTVFTKEDNISLDTFEIEMANAATWADLETDALTSPLKETIYEIKSRDIIGNIRKVKLKLSQEECSLIAKSFIDNAPPIT